MKQIRLPLWVLIYLVVFLAGGYTLSQAIEFYPVDISPWLNNDGIAGNNAPADGSYNWTLETPGGTYNLAAELLPETFSTFTVRGVPFRFTDKSDGKLNNIQCQGQNLLVPEGIYAGLYILGASTHGIAKEPLILVYKDMSEVTTHIRFPEGVSSPAIGDLPGIEMPYRILKTGNMDSTPVRLWMQSFVVDTGKELLELRLPDNNNLHLFCVSFSRNGILEVTPVAKAVSSVAAQKTFALSLLGDKAGNLFNTAEPLSFHLKVTGIPEEVKKMKLEWILNNPAKTLIARENMLLTRWTPEGFILPIQIPAQKAGWYQIRVSLQNPESGNLYARKMAGVAVYPQGAVLPELITGIGAEMDLAPLSERDSESIGLLSRFAGIKWVRQPFAWDKIQPAENTWNWSHMDRALETARKQGLQVIGSLSGIPGWAADTNQNNMEKFVQFVSQVVNRYKPQVQYWQIDPAFWKEPPAEFLPRLKAVSHAAIDANPDAKILLVKKEDSFFEGLLSAGGLDYCHGILVELPAAEEPMPVRNSLFKLREKMIQYDKSEVKIRRDIWVVQKGWQTGKAISKEEYSESRQAANIVKSCIESYLTGASDKYLLSNYLDDDSTGDNSGLLYRDISPKLSWLSLLTLINQLKGYSYQTSFQFNDFCHFYVFTKKGQKILAAWSSGDVEVIKLKTEVNTVTLTDMLGNVTIVPPSENDIFTLSLGEQPVYISADFNQIPEISGLVRMKLPQAAVTPGQKTDFRIKIKNLLSGDFIGDIAVQVSDTLQQNLFRENPEPPQPIEIKPGEEKEVQFKMDVPEKADTGFTPLEIRLDPRHGGGFRLQTELKIFNK
jgi:hypothetical protein